ncbi:MAG TPA: glycoside hydrolase family 9 protein [Longimicrobiales bacterium]|nr:glycoside hydrolase family 9 protein [Longimicrobiales bacterium]
MKPFAALRYTTFAVLAAALNPGAAAAQQPREHTLLPIPFEHSAERRWLSKPVLEQRLLDDMSDPTRWTFTGTGNLTFPDTRGPHGMRTLRVDVQTFPGEPAPTRSGLSTVNLRRSVAGEDWSGYNRLSIWVRADVEGLPMLPLQIVLHNSGADTIPDVYYREGIHYVTLEDETWHEIVWEIDPLPRDRVTLLEFGYWLNRLLAREDDHVSFEIGRIELQRVEPDHHTGWNVAPGRIAYSHTGYDAALSKTALASGLDADRFDVVRIDDTPLGDVVFSAPLQSASSPIGEFQVLDFSALTTPGRYVLRAGDAHSQPFAIGDDVWNGTVWKTLNWLYGQRCGFPVPGVKGVDHQDWLATHDGERIVMNGGWHDAGDLSQGAVNTGETTYALFALAERLQQLGDEPALLERVLEEAAWGLDWLLKVRFDGGYRIGFAGHNLWTNNIVGDEDDREREALNNPNVNYIAAAAEAIAARVLKDAAPELAARALRTARLDWQDAQTGVNDETTWSTPAFAATEMELASIGALASIELYRATGEQQYADRAVELARTIVASQQKQPVGTTFPLSGFFYTGTGRDTIFHQFHRGNDQAPIVALAALVEALPDHAERATWQEALELYARYQRQSVQYTSPYDVLPAYVYRVGDGPAEIVAQHAERYQGTTEAYEAQVVEGLEMGDGWYLRAFPVWYARRGNYGVLLSQATAAAAIAHVLQDSAALDLAHRQAQWIVGRNPFTQSTMYGEGYDWSQQYAVSSGDFVGALPVGMQSRGDSDLPYWPTQNMYVYKEVWVHSVGRWIWLMADLLR